MEEEYSLKVNIYKCLIVISMDRWPIKEEEFIMKDKVMEVC